jgi:hypothetical protein
MLRIESTMDPRSKLVEIGFLIEFHAGGKTYTLATGPFRMEVTEGIKPKVYRRRTALGGLRKSMLLYKLRPEGLQLDVPAMKIFGVKSEKHWEMLSKTPARKYRQLHMQWANTKNEKMVRDRRARFGQNGIKTPFTIRKK